MLYNQPYGGATNDPYVNGNPSTGTPGSIPPAAMMEYPQREIVEVISAAGLPPSNSVLIQLTRGIQKGTLVYGADAGTVNAYAITLAPAPLAYYPGMMINMLVSTSCTGSSTINVNSLGPKAVIRRGGASLLLNDLGAGTVATIIYNGTAFELVGTGFSGRPSLAANLTIYVNGAIGNDANDGVSNISGHAMATIQGGINLAFSYAPSQYAITIQIAAGTYAHASTPGYDDPNLILIGASASTVLVAAATSMSTALGVTGPNTMTVQSLTGQNNSSSGSTAVFVASNGSTMLTLNTASNGSLGAIFQSDNASLSPGNHTFNGNANELFYASFGGHIQLPQGTVYTIANAITVALATAVCGGDGSIGVPSPSAPTFVNPTYITGPKFYVAQAGGVVSSGAGTSYFPGSTAGTVDTATAGWYT